MITLTDKDFERLYVNTVTSNVLSINNIIDGINMVGESDEAKVACIKQSIEILQITLKFNFFIGKDMSTAYNAIQNGIKYLQIKDQI